METAVTTAAMTAEEAMVIKSKRYSESLKIQLKKPGFVPGFFCAKNWK